MSTSDKMVDQPSHYTSHPSGIECIEITKHMDFLLGNALKYIWRSELKDDMVQDLKKANWYLNKKIEEITKVDNVHNLHEVETYENAETSIREDNPTGEVGENKETTIPYTVENYVLEFSAEFSEMAMMTAAFSNTLRTIDGMLKSVMENGQAGYTSSTYTSRGVTTGYYEVIFTYSPDDDGMKTLLSDYDYLAELIKREGLISATETCSLTKRTS